MDYQDRVQWVVDELDSLIEDFTGKAKPGSRSGSLKRKAPQYLGKGAGDKLSKTDLKRLRAQSEQDEEKFQESRKRQRYSTSKTSKLGI